MTTIDIAKTTEMEEIRISPESDKHDIISGPGADSGCSKRYVNILGNCQMDCGRITISCDT